MKTCSKCGESKSLDAYQGHGTTADHLRPECRRCGSEYSKQWRYLNLEKCRAAGRRYKAANKEKTDAYNTAWANANPEKIAAYQRRSELKTTYGLSVEDYQRLVAEQGGRCAICGVLPDGAGRMGKLHVDHDHATGVVRQLLCVRCNLSIGQFEDDPTLLRAAANYIEFHQGRTTQPLSAPAT